SQRPSRVGSAPFLAQSIKLARKLASEIIELPESAAILVSLPPGRLAAGLGGEFRQFAEGAGQRRQRPGIALGLGGVTAHRLRPRLYLAHLPLGSAPQAGHERRPPLRLAGTARPAAGALAAGGVTIICRHAGSASFAAARGLPAEGGERRRRWKRNEPTGAARRAQIRSMHELYPITARKSMTKFL